MADTSLPSGAQHFDRNPIHLGLGDSLSRHGEALVLFALAAVAALLLVAPVSTIQKHVLNNYSEGWNAYLAQTATTGGVLYPDQLALTANNYPPLSFYVVGHLGVLLGDNIFAGRLIALLGVLVVTGNIFRTLRALRASRISAGFGALLFLAYTLSVFFGQIVIDDPIWLAEAFATTGLVLFLKSRGGSDIPGALMALVAIVAGLLAKHNILALPVALFVWCLFYDRKAFLTWTIGGTVLISGVVTVCYFVYGLDFFTDILLHQREYSMRHLAMNVQQEVIPYLSMATGAAALWLLDGANRMVRLITLYVLMASCFGFFFLGGIGVVDSVLYDLSIALAISCGLLVEHLRRDQGTWKPVWMVTTMLLLASPVVLTLPLDFIRTQDAIGRSARESAAVNDDVSFVAGAPGPVACQTLAFCYWAGKPATIDFFNTNQKIAKGLLSEEKITNLIESRYFSVVEFDVAPPPEQILPAAAMARLHALYRLARSDGSSLFYVPN